MKIEGGNLFFCCEKKRTFSRMGKFFCGLIFMVFVLRMWDQTVYGAVIASGNVTDTEGNKCGTLKWSIDSDGTFTVTGEGPGATYRPEGENHYDRMCPWDDYRDKIKKVVFMCKFSGTPIYHVNGGASLNSWFVDCTNLVSYSDIPDGVTDMSATFYKCESLQECGSIPDSVVVMQYTFAECKMLQRAPELPANLEDGVKFMYKNSEVGVEAFALGMTFSECSILKATPFFDECKKVNILPGTFWECNNLVTIQKLPANIKQLMNTFNNCNKVSGVFCSEAEQLEIVGTPFQNFSIENSYILFVKAKDNTLFDTMKEQSGASMRAYKWDDEFSIIFDTNEGDAISNRKIVMEYGVNMTNAINYVYSTQINEKYYTDVLDVLGSLPEPERPGLNFDGWYYDEELTDKVADTDVINPSLKDLNNKRMTIYAKWEDRTGPQIYGYVLDGEWFNRPQMINFMVRDNPNGGLKKIEMFKVEGNKRIKYWDVDLDGAELYGFKYTFGDSETKLFEGITTWEVIAEDVSGNVGRKEFEIKLDYTSPVIKTNSPYDNGEEIIYIEGESVEVTGLDNVSGPLLLKINPSNSQNIFIDSLITPVEFMGDFKIEYDFLIDDGIQGYVLYVEDKAGNIATRVIIRDKNLLKQIKRVIPRDNYD